METEHENVGDVILAVFDKNFSDLNDVVAITKEIVVTDIRNQEEIDKVAEAKKKLVTLRNRIKKVGLDLRGDINKTRDEILDKEKAYLAVISPEEDRLTQILEENKKTIERDHRMLQLPERKAQLEKIGDGIEITDDELLGMNETTFIEYKNARMQAHLDRQKAVIEEKELKEREENERIEREKQIEEAKEQAIRKEKERARCTVLTSLHLTPNFIESAYTLDDINVSFVEIKTLTDDEFSTLVEKIKKEIERRAEEKRKSDEEKRLAEEERKRQEDTAFQLFLTAHGYTEETKAQFHIQTAGSKTVLWKKVAEYEK